MGQEDDIGGMMGGDGMMGGRGSRVDETRGTASGNGVVRIAGLTTHRRCWR